MACRNNHCRFLPSATQEQFPAARLPSDALSHSFSKCWHAFCHALGVTDKRDLSGSFYAGPAKWQENNGAKMTSRLLKKFLIRISERK